MNFEQFTQPTALLFCRQPSFLDTLEQCGGKIIDADLFLDNLPLWGDVGNPTKELFSNSIPGLRQNLANTEDLLVGLYGKWLDFEALAQKYTDLGYNVLIFNEQEEVKKIFPAKKTERIFLTTDSSKERSK